MNLGTKYTVTSRAITAPQGHGSKLLGLSSPLVGQLPLFGAVNM